MSNTEKKDTSPMVQSRRIKRLIRIKEINTPSSLSFDVAVEYPSDDLPEWFAPLQPVLEDETFASMMINLGDKVLYRITVVRSL